LACGTRALVVLIEPEMRFTLELAQRQVEDTHELDSHRLAGIGTREIQHRQGVSLMPKQCVARCRFRRSGLQPMPNPTPEQGDEVRAAA
jgi:hypothetical protein